MKKICRSGRADISALLLIAFLFQLFMPILVFADDQADDSAFETALRNSICRVAMDDAPSSDPLQHLSNDFVCDWCLLKCSIDKFSASTALPDGVAVVHLAGPPQPMKGYERFVVHNGKHHQPLLPRAPPVSL